MDWFPRLSGGSRNTTSPAQMNIRESIESLRSLFETQADFDDHRWSRAAREVILTGLYKTFWGPYAHCFTQVPFPADTLLSEHQSRTDPHYGADIPGMPCGHIFRKGECCYKCKDCALDDSCVLCSRCFHASNHENHNVAFYLALQAGGCCDCGDREAWKLDAGCQFHPHTPAPRALDRPIPTPLREMMTQTIDFAIDFILDTLDHSPEETVPPTDEADILEPLGSSSGNGSYAVVIWNDEKHSFSELTSHLCDVTGCPEEEAAKLADTTDFEGRAVVEISPQVEHVFRVASRLSHIDLGVTVRRASDTFREEICSALIEWLVDLTRSLVNETDALTLREIVAARLFESRNKPGSLAVTARLPSTNPSRLEWLFFYHTRLWKRPRLNLKDLYITILNISHSHKVEMAVRFSAVYNRLMDSYLLVDREAETSVKYFAVQLFTVPSIAEHIVKHNRMIDRLLSIIIAFFTNQISNKMIDTFPRTDRVVNVDTPPFRSKRFMPIFSDLRYLCVNPAIQELIAHDETYITNFVRTCRLFVGINPNKRAVSNHVEYEQDAWISVFNVTLSLSRVVKAYAEAFSRGTTQKLCRALSIVADDILSTCTLHVVGLDRQRYENIRWCDVVFGDVEYSIIDFDVSSRYVSFHHAQHWLFAELLKHVDLLHREKLAACGYRSLRDMLLKSLSEPTILIILEFPLRVAVMIAQIRTGLWVRNGLAIRGQLLHYRDYMLRELCYDQDLFIIQSSFILSDPNTILVTILRRFQLLGWFSGDTTHTSYEGAQLYTMVEEFLYVLITSLSEYANARKLSVDEIVKREAIHALALGPCSYTDLCKRVAERIIDEASFDRALGEISTFRAPEGTSDVGIFELKDEMFDHVNPFFFHFTRNRREEVEGILKARLTRKTGITNPVIVPKGMGITEGPFVALAATFNSTAFLQILVFGVYNAMPGIRQTAHSSDAVLDQVLHLISLALVEQPASFSPLAARVTFPNAQNQTLLQLLCTLETIDTMKNIGNKLQWCLEVLIQYVPAEVAAVRRVQPPEIESVGGKSVEAKKRAAKARQAAIMKQFAAQQESFLLNIEDEVMSEDEKEPGSGIGGPTNSLGSCIVCQEALDSSRAFGALGLVQPSRFRREMPAHITRHVAEAVTVPKSLDDAIPLPTPPSNIISSDSFHAFPADTTTFGLHSSFCGHLMHMDCFTVYSFSIEQRHLQQTQRNHAENIDRDEFICPLCKSLGNVILPVRDDLTFKQSFINPPAKLSLTDWIRGVGIELLKAPQDRQLDQRLDVDGSGEFSFWTAEDADYPSGPPRDDTRRMVQTLKTVVQSVSEQSRHLHGRSKPSVGARGAGLYLPKHLVAYTISCMEISQRGIARSGYTLADGISDSSMHLIRASLVSLRIIAGMQFPDRADRGRTAIRQAVMKRMMPQWTRDLLRRPLFVRDALTLLVEVCAVAPDILPYATPLMYYACLARTCLGLIPLLSDLPSIGELPYPIPDEEHNDLFGDIRVFVLSLTRHSPVVERITNQILRSSSGRFEKLVYSFTLPFLRCAAILTRAVTACPLPEPTRTANNSSEYARLLDVLGIPPVPELPQMEGLQTVLAGWSETYAQVHSNALFDYSIKLEVPSVYRLTQLPYALDSLFMDTNTLCCQRCKTIPVDAAICMFCGTICCYQMHCCVDDRQRGEGECNLHTQVCGGIVGLYYCVKRCAMLYLYAGSGGVGPSPYLDVHGEVDFAMRRGRRQFLHPRRLEELSKLWMNHGIPTFVARKLDAVIDAGGWDSI